MPVATTTSAGDLLVRPIPDPTTLTTDQLRREITALRELLEGRISAGEKLADLVQKTIDARSEKVAVEIKHLERLHDEKFAGVVGRYDEKFTSVETQFKERDTRTDQAAATTKTAVDAALQAQKEDVAKQYGSAAAAVAKSEAATSKSIDQLAELMGTANAGLVKQIGDMKDSFNQMIGDIKDRITVIESKAIGGSASSDFGFKVVAGLGVVVSMLIGIGGIVVAIALRG
jgi:hypothetical protein